LKQAIWKERKKLWCALPFTFTVYSLFEDKFCIQSGLIRQQFDDIKLYRIIDVMLCQNILQRLFVHVKKQLAVVIEFAKGLNFGFEGC